VSIIGFYFFTSLLHETGWPRKQGLFRRLVVDTTVVDVTIDQMITWGASLGAGRPALALQIIANMFRNRNWDGDDAPQIEVVINSCRKPRDEAPHASPQEYVQPVRYAKHFGATISAKRLLKKSEWTLAWEQYVLEALIWGLADPNRFAVWYADKAQRHASKLGLYQRSGLAVDAMPALGEFFDECEQIVRGYEREVGSLPKIPAKLLSDARALGINVNETG
jgi:hypothetical protein